MRALCILCLYMSTDWNQTHTEIYLIFVLIKCQQTSYLRSIFIAAIQKQQN